MAVRHGSARWEGALKEGKGSFAAGKDIKGAYNFGSRFEEGPGSNPEELIAAAHAACFSMSLSVGLERAGTPAKYVDTKAQCTVERVEGAFAITSMKLTTRASVPGVDAAAFRQAAEAAKEGCPVSKALKGNVKIELDAQLE